MIRVLSALILIWPLSARAEGASAACPQEEASSIVVKTKEHRLYVCNAGRELGAFSIRIGKKGAGKRRQGDGKTPLGRYTLGAPRPSTQFGTFIPIGYPTAEQRKAGLTGGAVGIHGPHRWLNWAGAINNWFDTTDGCVGIANDAQMKQVSDWVQRLRIRAIEIN